MRLKLVTVLAAIVLLIGVSTAMADTIIYTLNAGNTAISGFPGPYATVTVDLTSPTIATITFDSLTNGSYSYLLGGAQAADVNVNASSFTLGAITGSNSFGSSFTPGPWSDGPGNVSEFGNFDETIDSFDGYVHSSTEISFTLTNTSGTWANAGDVLTNNANGYSAAAHVFVATNCTAAGCTGNPATGFAAVPEPASIALLGSGFLALGGFIRRRLTR